MVSYKFLYGTALLQHELYNSWKLCKVSGRNCKWIWNKMKT